MSTTIQEMQDVLHRIPLNLETAMEVRDNTRFAEYEHAALVVKIQRENTTPMLTYEGPSTHIMYQGCTVKIYRAIGNDSGLKREMTRLQLAKYEPNVGLWPGDHFEYWKDGALIHTHYA